MIKITANYNLRSHLVFFLISLLGLSACAPIPMPQFPVQLPQAYPVQPGVQAPRQQPAKVIPQAGALPTSPTTVASVPRSYPIVQQQPRQVVASKPSRQQSARVHVPPTLKPAQQHRAHTVRSSTKLPNATRYRPSASVARKPAVEYKQEPLPSTLALGRSSTSGNTKQRTAVVTKPGITGSLTPRTQSLPTIRPAPRPSAAVRSNTSASTKTAIARPEGAKKEVLDLSNTDQKPTAAVQAEKKPALPAAAPRSYNSSPAVSILIKQANNDLSAGKTDRAAATLERALRISPENPLLWLRLAEVNAQQGNKTQAASMARKAIGLAPGDANLQARGQRLMN